MNYYWLIISIISGVLSFSAGVMLSQRIVGTPLPIEATINPVYEWEINNAEKNIMEREVGSGVATFGSLRVGGPAPFNYKAGRDVSNGYHSIPPSAFYVYVYQNGHTFEFGCEFDTCGRQGAMVGTMGGWLHGAEIWESFDMFDIDTNADGHFITGETSLIVIADRESTIVGLYPNERLENLTNILKNHPDLANFELLKGISQVGNLKVGQPLPKLPKSALLDTITEDVDPVRFKVYYVWNKPKDGGCIAYECGYYYEKIIWAGGQIFEINAGQTEALKQLGLDPGQVSRAEVSLIGITDANSTVVAIHPNKRLRDVITILNQHPGLADERILDNGPWGSL